MYPEQAYSDLREAVAGWLELPPETIVPAHGIQALIAAVAHTFIREGRRRRRATADLRPLRAGVRAGAGAHVVRVPNRDFRLDLLRARRRGARAKAPGSSGSATRTTRPARSSRPASGPSSSTRLPDGAVAVVDEAYREYADPERARRPGARRPRRPARRPPSHLLEDLRPRRASASATRSRTRSWRRSSTSCRSRST